MSHQVARGLFPDDESFQMQARRSVTHEAVYLVCKWLTGRGSAPQHLQPIVRALGSDAAVTSVADSLIGLKEAREEADYDHTRPFDKRETLTLLKDARATVTRLRAAGPSLDQAMALIAIKTTPR